MVIDVVIPCYNDVASLNELMTRLQRGAVTITDAQLNYIVIDNASTIPVRDQINNSSRGTASIEIYRLAANIGYSGAIAFGLHKSYGDYCLVIDSDLEDPPHIAVEMIKKIVNDRADIVYGVRIKRNTSIRLKFFYNLFYFLFRYISDNKVNKDAGEFAVYSAKSVERIKMFKLHDNFLRGVRTLVGGVSIPHEYVRDKRYTGETRFNFYSSFDLAVNGLLFNTKKPLRFITLIGIIIYGITGIVLFTNLILKVINILFSMQIPYILPAGLTQTSLIIYFMLLVLFLAIILVGEYVMRMHHILLGRPSAIIEEKYDTKQ